MLIGRGEVVRNVLNWVMGLVVSAHGVLLRLVYALLKARTSAANYVKKREPSRIDISG